jgi:hypothetical protein
LGKQHITDNDLERIADCLDIPLEQLLSSAVNKTMESSRNQDGFLISQKVLDLFPDLGEYLEMLENASRIDDRELIEYLSKRIADIWQEGPNVASNSPKKIGKTTKGEG